MRRRGVALMELLLGMVLMLFIIFGSVALLLTGTQSFARVTADTSVNMANIQGLRRVSETIRGAMNVSLNLTGTEIYYNLPARTASNDAVTGEREYVDPLTSDGVARSFKVNFTAGTLTDGQTGRILIRNIVQKDPQPGSSQFNQIYAPFQLTTIGSMRAISINFITQETVKGEARYSRMKTTAVIRNTQ